VRGAPGNRCPYLDNEECRSWGCNGETANSWECWRQRIDRVEPFFACILGQRYGWVPERKVDT